MRKKLLAFILTGIVGISAITGCGSSSNTGGKELVTVGITQIAPHGSLDNCREGFIAGLEEEGYKEGENITYDYQNASGETANAVMIAEQFVSKKYNLICGIATPTAMAAFSAARESDIPVVFTAVSDPVAAELVESLEKPGLNCTGTCDSLPLEEQMQMIRAFLPDAKTIGILYTTSEVNSLTHLEKFQELAPKYGFTIEAIGVTTASDIPIAVDTLLPKVDCINNFTDNNVVNNLDTLVSKANEANIPVFGSEEEQVRKGCIAAQNIDYFELGKETGKMAAKILKGESTASELPVSIISDCTPVANQEVMDQFQITIPEEYKDSVTYLTAEQ